MQMVSQVEKLEDVKKEVRFIDDLRVFWANGKLFKLMQIGSLFIIKSEPINIMLKDDGGNAVDLG